MRVLLTEGTGLLGERLRAALAAGGHEVRVLDGDPRDRATAAAATAGVEAVVCAVPTIEQSVGGTVKPAELPSDPLPGLDWASRGVYNLITTASEAGVSRFVLLSTLRPFERYPLDHRVTEYWAPRPTTDPRDLVPFTAEGVVREAGHTLPLKAVCLRLGTVSDGAGAPNPRAVHVEDVAAAVERALVFEPPSHTPRTGWWAFHVVGAGRTRFALGLAGTGRPEFQDGRNGGLGYAPKHDLAKDAPLVALESEPARRFTGVPSGGARKVVLFGAGGPLAAITAQALERDHVLRLTDRRPLAEIVAAGKPQSRGAPFPKLLGPPHEVREVDVTDYAQVLEATRGMDAVVNMTVVRPDPVEAFRVNTLGAYNVARAAVACGIRRVVQTGPQQVTNTMPGGYWPDFDLPTNVPPRPGVALYFISKFLGHELVRVFAEEHDLEAPTLVFGPFTNPEDSEPDQLGCYPFLISWADAAEALRGALRAPSFERPFEYFHIVADLPHGKYRNDRTKKVLHWQPRDNLDVHWRRPV